MKTDSTVLLINVPVQSTPQAASEPLCESDPSSDSSYLLDTLRDNADIQDGDDTDAALDDIADV